MIVIIVPLIVVAGFVIVNLLHLANQVAGYQNYWSEQNRLSPTEDAITYVALGDSSAQGIGASDPEKGYVGLIARAISEKTGKPVRIINLSKSGAKVEHVITEQLPLLNQYDIPKDAVYTIQIGANDIVRDFDIEGFENDMKSLLTLLPTGVFMSDLPSFKRTRFGPAEDNIQKANERMYSLAEANGIRLVPLYETTNRRASWRNNAIDIFHPNNRGYRNWFEAFWQRIEPEISK